MKRYSILCCLFFVLLPLSACAAPGTAQETTQGSEQMTEWTAEPPTETSPAELTAEEASPAVVPQYGGWGPGPLVCMNDTAFDAIRKAEATVMGGTYPVYVNEYAMSFGGPLYEITEELTEMEREDLKRYLTLLYGDDDYVIERNPYGAHAVSYDKEGWSFFGHVNNSISAGGPTPFAEKPTHEELLQNEMVVAALSYADIGNPVIEESVEFSYDGTVCSYVFQLTDASVSGKIQSCFQKVYISVSPSSDPGDASMLIQVSCIDPETLVRDSVESLPGAESVDAFLRQIFPNDPPQDYCVDVTYSAKANPGYFVPIYRVYAREPAISGEYGQPMYSVVEITAENLLPPTADDVE